MIEYHLHQGLGNFAFSPSRCCCCLAFIDDFERSELGPNWLQTQDASSVPITDWTISGGQATCSTAGAVLQTQLFVTMPGDPLIEFDLVSVSGEFVFGGGTYPDGSGGTRPLGLVFNGSTVEQWSQDGSVFGSFPPFKSAEATIGAPPYHVQVCNRADQTFGVWVNDAPLFAYSGQMPFQPQFKIKSGSASIDNVAVHYRRRETVSGRDCGICQSRGWFPVGRPDEITVTIAGLTDGCGTCSARNGTFVLSRVDYAVGSACWTRNGTTSGSREQYQLDGDFGCGATRMLVTIPARSPSIWINYTNSTCATFGGAIVRGGHGSLPVGATTIVGNTLGPESFSITGPAYWQRDTTCTGTGTVTIEASYEL